MIAVTYSADFVTDDGLGEITLVVESWHSTSRTTLFVTGRWPQRFASGYVGLAAFHNTCREFNAYQSWEFDHEVACV